MPSVPLKDLKENLSHWAEEAAKGNVVHVTKYNRPYVALVPGRDVGLHRGRLVGRGHFKPALKKPIQGDWLRYLLEDREDP
ncbi:MAG: hypothetical protein HY538_08875 [Deltaproteobacteria bacterium]|nr:hypothetical protein [Deltaproteobacteria bacterium]